MEVILAQEQMVAVVLEHYILIILFQCLPEVILLQLVAVAPVLKIKVILAVLQHLALHTLLPVEVEVV